MASITKYYSNAFKNTLLTFDAETTKDNLITIELLCGSYSCNIQCVHEVLTLLCSGGLSP